EVIENGNSWVFVPQTAQENGTSVTKIQYNDAKTMFAAIETQFGGNEATKKTQKTLLKQQYENFSASSAESLDCIFNRLQKIVSRLAFLGVVIAQEDLNSKFLSSLPPEWNTHVVVWMNKPEIEIMSIDDLYNNFIIVKQKVKKYVAASSGAQNLAFMTAPSTSSTNDVNTASPQVSTASPNVNTASPQVSTASPNVNTASPQVSTTRFNDNAMYAFMVENPNGSNLLHQDLKKIHEDDLEAMDLKWQLSLLSMRAKRYYQRTGKKIFINANDTTGYDRSKVECFNYHKVGHFAKECRAPRSKEGQFKNQDNTRKQGNNEDTSSKAMLAIDGVGLDWSDMAEEQCDDLIVKLNQTEFTAATYKRGLATVKEQLITYRKNKVLFREEVAVLKREVAYKDYEINVLKSEFEKVEQEKEGIKFKIEKFDKASKDLDKLLESQITDKSKKGLGYSDVPLPHPLIYNRPKKLDLSYSEQVIKKITSSFVESSALMLITKIVFPGESQKEDGIFISQDKYVAEILNKFNYTDVKSASTLVDSEKSLVKDRDADDVDVHLYRSMIGSLMYLTTSRPYIMFVVCACARFQVTTKTSHLLAVKRIFRYLKGKPTLGLLYFRDSPFELVAYTDSDYAGATQDRKSTTGGYQFLGNMLISWQYKKQTVVATATTEAEYVAAASCCGQVIWIQNQLLDYGYDFMNTVINIDNNSTICIIENPVQHSKTKHIEIRHHFIRDCNAKKLIQMVKIHTDHNVADLLTKGFDAGRHVKRGRDTKIPQSSGPPVKVGDEAVHKELGDRMERAATTASSLEAEQDSGSGPRCQDTILGDVDAQTRFETTSKQSNDPPLSRGYTLGSGEDSMKLLELMELCTKLSNMLHKNRKSDLKTATLSTNEDGVRGITATIDRKVKIFISEAAIRRHLKLEDSEGLKTLPSAKIFKQLAVIGLSPKKTAWEQFSSNIATAILCLATIRTFNFSNLIFEAMVKNLNSRVDIPLFPTMLTAPESSPSRITSSLSLSPQTHPSTSQSPSTPPFNQTTPITEEAALMPHESPLQSIYSLGRDKGSLSLNELTDLCTSLSKKKLEQTIKTSQARRRAKVVISNDKEVEEDPSNQGRSLIEELDLDVGIYLVPPYAEYQGSAATALADASRRRRSVENVQTYIKRSRLVSTTDISTASRLVSTADISTANELDSTAGIKAKDKGKAIMHESEPLKKIKKREARLKAEQEQERLDFETTLELQKQLDEREEVAAKNQGGYKMSHFKGMSYEDIRPIFERVWDQNQAFIPMVEGEIVQQDDVIAEQAVKESSRIAGGRRKKSLARKRARETLKESLDVESLATKYPIVDWETQILANDKYYYQIKRADGSVKHYKIFSAMLYDFDRKEISSVHKIFCQNVSRKLEVDHQSDMGYELIRFVKSQLQH
ncbi:putative ribonuclease H-like domain-containing protein, partial [Tanacetum coccineum]